MKPTTMVLGATGFLGAHVARSLDRRGSDVHATRRPASDSGHVDDVEIEWHQVDLDADGDALERALDPCDAVLDCAGFYPNNGLDIDGAKRRGVGRLRRVLEASRRSRIGRVVYVSSPVTLGWEPSEGNLLGESDFYTPGSVDNAYHEAKFSTEAEVYRYLAGGPPVVIAIPGAVFGPADVKPTTGEFLVHFANGRFPALVPGTFNAVDVRDVAESLVAALEQGRPGRRYILGGHNVDVPDFVELAAEFCDAGVPGRMLPPEPVRVFARLVERAARPLGYDGSSPLVAIDMIRRTGPLSNERATGELGHDPRPLAATLQDSFDWFREHDYI